MHPVEKQFNDFFRSKPHVKGKLLLACSGGVDSMVLAYLLKKANFPFALAHCNFQLRGEEADSDQRLVEGWARNNSIQVFSETFNTWTYSLEKKVSVEMAARELRYTFFDNLMKEHGFLFLVTAHHADDSLETILLNLGRGTGLTGLSGIHPDKDQKLRPLWLSTKKEIAEVAEHNNIPWREDHTNQSNDFLRNRLRNNVIPALKESFPSFDQSFEKSLQHLQRERELFHALLESKFRELVSSEGDTAKLDIAHLITIPGYTALLRMWLQPKGFTDPDSIKEALGNPSGQKFFSSQFELLVDRQHLILRERKKRVIAPYKIEKDDEQITDPVKMQFSIHKAANFDLSADNNQAAFDLDKLEFPLVLRKWRDGDTFQPLGMNGTKKLSDFFTDLKLSQFQKKDLWLLCSGPEIVWITGYRIDDRYKVTNTTKTVYFVELI